MPTIRRDDGAQFVVQSYRELLSSKKIGALKREIRALAKNHGEYVRCFKQSSGQMEAVFSREPGFLFGEIVWDYFGRPDDLIYCEALPDKQHALLVIVREGSVYLDAKIGITDLLNEFVALATNNERYVIYVHGVVPLSDVQEDGAFVFDRSRVQSFKRLDDSILSHLEFKTAFQLQPLELALTSPEFARKVYLQLTLVGLLAFFGYLFWHSYQVETTALVKKIADNPYASYYRALMTPAPTAQLKELVDVIGSTYSLPGWQVSGINFDGDRYRLKLKAISGEGAAPQLQVWAKLFKHDVQIGSAADEAMMFVDSNLPNRQKPANIYNLQHTIDKLFDALIIVVPEGNIIIGSVDGFGMIRTVKITIKFNDFSPAILLLLGKVVQELPAQLVEIDMNTQDNLLSGTIQMVLWGN